MSDMLDLKASTDMLKAVSQSLIDQTDVLTDADLVIGDGDHGIGMRRGFEASLESLGSNPDSIEAAFKAVGTAILSQTGGAAGTVFGTLFRAGSKSFAESPAVDGDNFAAFLEVGLQAVLKRGGASEGQKTMIDALAPAARAAREKCRDGFAAAAAAAATASFQGVEATKCMVATTGKARSLGERSLGHPDPGAITVSLILKAMQEFAVKA